MVVGHVSLGRAEHSKRTLKFVECGFLSLKSNHEILLQRESIIILETEKRIKYTFE